MRQRPLMKAAITSVMLGIMLLWSAPSPAQDAIVFKTGKRIEGRVVERPDEPTKVYLLNPSTGATIGYDKTQIERVDKASEKAAGDLAATAQASIDGGRPAEAVAAILRAAEGDPAVVRQLATPFNTAVYKILESARADLAANNSDAALTNFTVLVEALSKPVARDLSMSPENHQRVDQAARAGYGEAAFSVSAKLINQPGQLPRAQQLLTQAVQLNPENMTFRLFLARVANSAGDRAVALSSYQAIAAAANAPADAKTEANSAIQQLQGGGAARPAAEPNPQAQPGQGAVAGPPQGAQPAPQAQPEAQPAEPEATPAPPGGQWYSPQRLMHTLKYNPVTQYATQLGGTLMTGDTLPMIVGIIAAVLLLYVIPVVVIKKLAYRGNTHAAKVRMLSKKIGIFAFIPMMTGIVTTPGVKNKCPFCNKSLDNLDSYGDLNFYKCPHCNETITPVYELGDYIKHLMESMSAHASRPKGSKGGDVDTVIEKDSMMKLVRAMLTLSVRRRASDLHMDSEMEGTKMRARIDGVLYDLLSVPKPLSLPLISALKIMADLDITERRMPQDGKINMWIDKADVDLRINTSPAAMGEKVSIRILNPKNIAVDPTKLGLEGENLEKFERAIHKPHGLIVVTGPSGSGKSTTLYVALNEINTGDKNIITLEDPIEYQLKGLTQMQVNPAANFTFATGLRSILRQDPDVIMVGEIRDRETAEIAIEAAMTGHLVFSTLHTIDAPTAFGRLNDLGIESKRVASAIIAVIAQRLVRMVCPECKKPYKPKKTDIDLLGIAEAAKEHEFMHGPGCPACMNTGFFGRLALYEFMVPNDTMREMLEANAAVSVLRELARNSGYRTLREEGILRVMQSMTTVEEVIRVTT